MKKVRVVFLFIIGFIAVFLLSGFISYLCFSRGGGKADEIKPTESVDELPKVNVPMQDDGNLTIITPGLNENETIVRYGTKDDIVIKPSDNKNSAEVSSFDEALTDDNALDADEKKTDEKSENKAENKTDATVKKETEVNEKPKTETKTEVKTEQKAENKPVEKPVEEKPVEAVEIPQEEIDVKPQKPELNPNVQTSDSGL